MRNYSKTIPPPTTIAVAISAILSLSGCLDADISRTYLPLEISDAAGSRITEITVPATEFGSTEITILTNRSWSANINPATDWVSLSEEGDINLSHSPESTTLRLDFSKHLDWTQARNATLEITTEEEKITIPLCQLPFEPELTVDLKNTRTSLLPGSGVYPVSMTCNTDWSATISEGWDGLSLSSDSGDLSLIVSEYDMRETDMLQTRNFSVTITTPSGLSEKIDYTTPGHIIIPFKKYGTGLNPFGWSSTVRPWYTDADYKKELTPRNDKGKDGEGTGAGSGTFQAYDRLGHSYEVFSGDLTGALYAAGNGLVIGSDQPGLSAQSPSFYISTPAIEDKKLSRVLIMPGYSSSEENNGEIYATGLTSAITDTDGNVISGGELQTVQPYTPESSVFAYMLDDYNENQDSIFDFTLSDTQNNISYRIVGTSRQVIRWIVLYYE